MLPNQNEQEAASAGNKRKPEEFYKQVKKDGEKQADAAAKVKAYLKELKQTETKKRMEELRRQIGLSEKKTAPVSLADLKTKIMDSQHRKLAASDFEPMAVAAQKKPEIGVMPPADMEAAKLEATSAITPPPFSFWGKVADRMKWLVNKEHRDIRAEQKFAAMSADTDETPTDRRAAAKGEVMMRKVEKSESVDADVRAIKSPVRDAFIKIDDAPGKFVDKVISDRMYKKAGEKATELKLGLREGQKEYDLDRKAEAFETKHTALGGAEFKKALKAGKLRAKAEQLETEMESEAQPGPNAEKSKTSMEKFKQGRVDIYEKLKDLRPIVESIKLGWFAHLKVDSEGYIINMPEGNENIVLEHLAKEKERLGAKGKIDKANEIVEQMEALEKYTPLLVERDKLLTSAGQDNFLLPKTNK